MSEGFFSRWSRRKLENEGAQTDAEAVAAPSPPPTQPSALPPTLADPHPAEPASFQHATLSRSADQAPHSGLKPDDNADPSNSQPLPTLEDVQRLTRDSDFQPFMRSGVDGQVRNAAMKKLFADPHFNVMDGLDVYIEDYNTPDPMPAGMLRKMASAQFLKLVPQGDPAQAAQALPTADPGLPLVAQSPHSSFDATALPHDHPDLQLQPDPAPADPNAEPSAG